jgi:hypothetical protein
MDLHIGVETLHNVVPPLHSLLALPVKTKGKNKLLLCLPSMCLCNAPKCLIAMCDITQLMSHVEPWNFHEAMVSPDAHLWLIAMQKEIHSILGNATWMLCLLPDGRNLIDLCWTFKVKVSFSVLG